VLRWVPFEKVSSYFSISAVCLVPHNDFEHTQTTVPYKLFQSMISGKPVVVSDVRPLKRIVDETGAGLVFNAGDPSSLAAVLVELYQKPELADRLGRNGYSAAQGLYSWRHDAERLIRLYDEMDRSKCRQAVDG